MSRAVQLDEFHASPRDRGHARLAQRRAKDPPRRRRPDRRCARPPRRRRGQRRMRRRETRLTLAREIAGRLEEPRRRRHRRGDGSRRYERAMRGRRCGREARGGREGSRQRRHIGGRRHRARAPAHILGWQRRRRDLHWRDDDERLISGQRVRRDHEARALRAEERPHARASGRGAHARRGPSPAQSPEPECVHPAAAR